MFLQYFSKPSSITPGANQPTSVVDDLTNLLVTQVKLDPAVAQQLDEVWKDTPPPRAMPIILFKLSLSLLVNSHCPFQETTGSNTTMHFFSSLPFFFLLLFLFFEQQELRLQQAVEGNNKNLEPIREAQREMQIKWDSLNRAVGFLADKITVQNLTVDFRKLQTKVQTQEDKIKELEDKVTALQSVRPATEVRALPFLFSIYDVI